MALLVMYLSSEVSHYVVAWICLSMVLSPALAYVPFDSQLLTEQVSVNAEMAGVLSISHVPKRSAC